jgi:hypothetical protein
MKGVKAILANYTGTADPSPHPFLSFKHYYVITTLSQFMSNMAAYRPTTNDYNIMQNSYLNFYFLPEIITQISLPMPVGQPLTNNPALVIVSYDK